MNMVFLQQVFNEIFEVKIGGCICPPHAYVSHDNLPLLFSVYLFIDISLISSLN